MGYTLELGYPTAVIGDHFAKGDFELAAVTPFEGGSELAIEPVATAVYEELYEPVDEDEAIEANKVLLPLMVTDEGKMEAEISITFNYSARIKEVTGTGLHSLDQQTAATGAALLLVLLAGLQPEAPSGNYWEPTDGNIGHIASILLSWTFEHPDATFKVMG